MVGRVVTVPKHLVRDDHIDRTKPLPSRATVVGFGNSRVRVQFDDYTYDGSRTFHAVLRSEVCVVAPGRDERVLRALSNLGLSDIDINEFIPGDAPGMIES